MLSADTTWKQLARLAHSECTPGLVHLVHDEIKPTEQYGTKRRQSVGVVYVCVYGDSSGRGMYECIHICICIYTYGTNIYDIHMGPSDDSLLLLCMCVCMVTLVEGVCMNVYIYICTYLYIWDQYI